MRERRRDEPRPYSEADFEKRSRRTCRDQERGDACWLEGDPENYAAQLGLDPNELDAFIAATQADAWQSAVVSRFSGDEQRARATFHQTVAKMLDSQGALRCLRTGVTVLGVDFDLGYFRPEHGLTTRS